MADFVSEIIRCTNFAAIKHKDQRRKNSDKTPYINHPIESSEPTESSGPNPKKSKQRASGFNLEWKDAFPWVEENDGGVAYILTQEAGVTDVKVVQAALLHDTVEDTDTTFEELEEHFGEEVTGLVREVTDDKTLPKLRDYVTGLVREVTDDKTLPKLRRKELQIEHSPHLSPKAKLVKLADKLYNLRDLCKETPEGWSEERVQEYFEWAAKVIAGVRGTNKALEDALDTLFKQRNVAVP